MIDTEIRSRAIRLHRAGVSRSSIARSLGVSFATILRWTDPEYAERQRRQSLEAKRRRTGVCELCGGETRYNGVDVSRICISCHTESQIKMRHWNRERVIAAIQEWARRRGAPPVAKEWINQVTDPDGYRFPARSSVYRHKEHARHNPFGTWADAIEAAGFPRPRSGIYQDENKRRRPRKVAA